MTVNYNFSNLVSIVKNGAKQNKNFVKVLKTNFNKELLLALSKKGFIKNFSISNLDRSLYIVELNLKVKELSQISLVSNSTNRVFLDFKKISKLFKPSDFFVVSTSKGLLLGSDIFFYGLGGELLLKIN
jgi:ribosomal protein S8